MDFFVLVRAVLLLLYLVFLLILIEKPLFLLLQTTVVIVLARLVYLLGSRLQFSNVRFRDSMNGKPDCCFCKTEFVRDCLRGGIARWPLHQMISEKGELEVVIYRSYSTSTIFPMYHLALDFRFYPFMGIFFSHTLGVRVLVPTE